MTKHDYVTYWLEAAEKSWGVSMNLFEKTNFVESLFFAHLALEKDLKAHWVKDNDADIPPRIHNLRQLAAQTNLELSNSQKVFLELMNTFQIEGRYPDYQFTIYQRFNQQETQKVLEEVEIFHQWLRSKML